MFRELQLRLALLCCGSLLSLAAIAQQVDPLFRTHDLLEVRIQGPLADLAGDPSDDPLEREGRFSFSSADVPVDVAVGLRPRGKSRRQRSVCVFPPLWLDFEKKTMAGTLFANQDKLKLVTHCGLSSRYEQHLLREYLAYRVLNLLTDRSFRVRLLRVEYRDMEGDEASFTKYGFLVEHQKRLAERLGVSYEKPDGISRDTLEPDHASLIELFEYFLGNVDFSLISGPEGEPCCHNVKLFAGPEGRTFGVPYDFDVSGFVDPPYGYPNRELRQRSLSQRIYRGYCRPGDSHLRAVARFQERRAEIMALIAQQVELDGRNRRQVEKYVEDFYRVLDDQGKLRKRVLEACR